MSYKMEMQVSYRVGKSVLNHTELFIYGKIMIQLKDPLPEMCD